MTGTLHKLTAGDGYTYLTRQVASNDGTERGAQALSDYYLAQGERPGVWAGRGLSGLGIVAGAEVSEAQMKALYGEGIHPDADAMVARAVGEGASEKQALEAVKLGRKFRDAAGEPHPFQVEVGRRFQAWNKAAGQPTRAAVPADVRAAIRSSVGRELFAAEYGRAPLDQRELAGYIAKASRPRQQSCAGFDVTFSPVKSVSTLWAVAPREVSEQIEAAHAAAVNAALQWMEAEVSYTRRGTNGVRQVDTNGLIVTQFQHRDSRAGDPDLHTHMVVSNKVQDANDGAWLALDGAVLFQAMVSVSEHYNTALEAELEQRLGVRFEARAASVDGKRVVREVAGVDPGLMRAWSTRRLQIESRTSELAAQFQAAHDRAPTPRELVELAQQANLETREAKHEPRSFAEQRQTWAAQAEQLLGPGRVNEMVHGALSPSSAPAQEWSVEEVAQLVVDTVETQRAVFSDTHLYAEAQRRLRGKGLRPGQLPAAAAAVVARVLGDSTTVAISRTDPISEPAQLRRRDGQSVYDRAHSRRFTSTRVLEAERSVLQAAGRSDGRRLESQEVDLALLESTANGVELNPGQAEMVRSLATSGRRVQLALAPAGSGKTTAMKVLSRAWSDSGGTVLALAPSAAAARELGAATGGSSEVLAKLIHEMNAGAEAPEWVRGVDENTLLVVDEAGMASTADLATVTGWALARGASVRLIGDDQQLASVQAGGLLRDVDAHHGSVTLTELMRFSDAGEAAATLAAREGSHAAIGFWLDRGRVHLTSEALVADQVYQAWQNDRAAGKDSLMLAHSREVVNQLNARARLDRIAETGQPAGATVRLREQMSASAGDVVVTRRNNRELRFSSSDFVKNGDRWEVVEVGADGALQVRHLRANKLLTLPATYVAQHVDLGYASTIHSAQGLTVDTTHTVLTGEETRQLLYVATTRGRHANHLHLSTAGDGDSHKQLHPDHVIPLTATDVLGRVLDRDGAQRSAHTEQRESRDPALVLQRNADIWTDALSVACADLLGPERSQALTAAAERLVPGLSSERAWDRLHGHLMARELDHGDAIDQLAAAVGARQLIDGLDRAAVLDWRLEEDHVPGPLPWLEAAPVALQHHPTWQPYLAARAAAITKAAHQVASRATATAEADLPIWAKSLTNDPALLADVAVWRAARGIPDTDTLPVGSLDPIAAPRRHQTQLTRRIGYLNEGHGRQFAALLEQLEPRVTQDPWWPILGRRLDLAAQAGADVDELLAANTRDLPDDMAAAALWWRLAPHIGPTVATAEAAPRLHPRFATALLERLPEGLGERTMRSTQWQELVDVLTDAEDHHGIPAESLIDAAAQLAGIDRLGQVDGPNPNDVPTLLLARIHDLVEGPPTPEDPEPAPVFPDHDYSDGIPTPEPPRGVDSAAVTEGADEVEQQWLATQLDTDRAVDEQARQRIVELHLQAAQFYRGHYAGSPAANWISSRFGTDLADDPRIIIGYAPASWTALTDHLRQNGATLGELIEAGLTKMSRRGTPIDIFRDRVVVGLRDDQGDLVGFSGRLNPADTNPANPKYLNTPTTLAFRKGEILYGYAENADRLLAGSTPVRVEGVFDAIAVTHATDGAAVGLAPLGTALTHAQAEQIAAAAQDRPILHATDNDPAGRAAAIKDSDVLNHHGVDVRQLVLVDLDDPTQHVKDPAESLQRDGGRAIRAVTGIVEAAPTLTGEVVRDLVDRTKPETLRERVDVRALVTSQVAQVIAASPTKLWAEEIQHAAALIADRSMDHDTSWYLDQLEAETAEAAMSWESPAARSGDGLQELADRGVEKVRAERQRRISARLAATRAGDPARPARPVDRGAMRPSAQERLLRLRELLRDDHPAPPTQPGPPTPPAPEEPPRPGGPEREL